MRTTRITFITAAVAVLVVALGVAVGAQGSDSPGTTRVSLADDGVAIALGEPTYRSDSDLPGSPGTMTFTFEAAGSGETELRMIYHRSWEDASPIQTFSLSITVG